jgi:hypothetical protein
VPKVHNKPIQDKRKGSYKRSKVVPKAALVWRTGLSGAPGNPTPNLLSSGILRAAPLKFTGLSGATPDYPVCQRSNDYFVPTVVCITHSMRYSVRQSQSSARRRTGQCTVTVRCTIGLSSDREDRSSNGRTLTIG